MFSEQQKTGILVTAFIGVVVLIVIVYFHFMLGRGMIKDNLQRTEQLRADVDASKAKLADINRVLAQKDELEKRSEAIQKVTRRLPSQVQAPGFLDALRTTLRMTGIIHEDIVSEKAQSGQIDQVLRKFSNNQVRGLLKSTSSCALYTEIPYIIYAHGRYHALGQFLTLVEQNPLRFMRVKYLCVRNSFTRPSVHEIEMVVETFMFNDVNQKAKNKA